MVMTMKNWWDEKISKEKLKTNKYLSCEQVSNVELNGCDNKANLDLVRKKK